ncbi:S41 family peptidase [Massilia aerilata]|uniref:S41 family peptidase n=1 Tax=Massilia aerilata TaxID=453817 RepID=A0ABW0RXI6_9BURK
MPGKLNAVLVALCLLGSAPAPAQTASAEPVYSAAAMQQDFRFMRAEIDRIHPEPGLFTSREALRKAYDQVEAQLRQPLTRDQAWRALATLNPVFADGHMSVVFPDLQALTRAHLAAGGLLFPYEVEVSADGEIAIRSDIDGSASALAGMRIEQINGMPAARVARELLARAQGDTPALRAHVLSRHMWFEYWHMFGAPRQFDLVVAKPAGPAHLRVAGSGKIPAVLDTEGPSGFKKIFQFALLPGNAALLTINHFLWPDQQAYNAFIRDAFAKIRDAKVSTLIIDVRQNPGGDDGMWKELLSYLADKPFRNGSSYVKKVIAGRASGSEKVGDVVHGFGDTWCEPGLNNPLHYSGKTYVLVGRMTYSSAVLFSNVVQDFGFAQLVGAGGYARTRQTGGVQNIILPNTGLQMVIPRFVLDRPSGERDPALVHPDILLPDSPFDRMVTVDALLEHLRRTREPSA